MKIKNAFILFMVFISLSLAEDYDIYDDSGGTKSNYAEPKTSNRKVKKQDKKKDNKQNTSLNSKNKYTSNSKSDVEGENESIEVVYPNMQGQILSEYNISFGDRKNLNDKSSNNSFLYSNAEISLNFNNNFFAGTEWTFRPVSSRLYQNDMYANTYRVKEEGKNDFFGKEGYIRREKLHTNDYGLAVNQLNLNFVNSNLAFGIGKVEASFANAYSKYRFMGTNGIEIPLEYALKNKIGAYLSALFPFGSLQFNIFYNDTSYLSNTMFSKIGKDNSKNLPGSTEKMNNFSLSFNGTFNDLTISLGWRYINSQSDIIENGYSLSIEYLKDYENNIKLLPFFEMVHINNFNATKGRNVFYGTFVLPVFFENWHFLVSNTTKYDSGIANNSSISYLNQISFGYKIGSITFDIAKVWQKKYLYNDINEKFANKIDSWNFVISYLYKF